MKRLISSVAQLEQVLHGIANGITVQDTAGRLVFVNRAAARMMNCDSPEEALRKGGPEIIKGFKFYDEHGRPVEVSALPGRLALQGVEEPEMVVGYVSDKSAEMQWTSIKAMPIIDDQGKVTLAVNVLQDITKLKEAERRLRETNDRVTKLLEEVLLK